ncbi:MAG: response regulator transcription factor [Aristaeellaceae bacterium]
MAEILIMEPDDQLSRKMCDVLTRAGHHCTTAKNVSDGLTCIRKGQRLLTLLNARLPWADSFTFLRTLEEKGWPLLFITSDAANSDHLRAMYQAACDVLVRPFDARQLMDGVSTLLQSSERVLTLGGLCLDVQGRTATLDGRPLTLTAQEFALLQALMQSPDAALTREQLLRTAWGYQAVGETRTVDVHVQRLRRKLGAACIETVYKLGYRLRMA